MTSSKETAPLPPRSRLAIIGAGPVGLEAAALAVSRGLDTVVFEKGEVGHHLFRWGHVRLFSPFSMNHSDWGPGLITRASPGLELPEEGSYLTGREYRERYLLPLSQIPGLRSRLFPGTEVVHLGKEGIGKADWIGDPRRGRVAFRLLTRRQGREHIHRSDAVLDCSGVYSQPRFLGNGNIPVPGELEAGRAGEGRLSYDLVDLPGRQKDEFRNARVLLVGGGYSAATALEGFARLAREGFPIRVCWLNRNPGQPPFPLFENDPLPYRDELGRLANRLAAEPPPWLRYLGNSHVEEILGAPRDGFRVEVSTPGGSERLEADRILGHTGFMPDNAIHRQLQVHECYATAGPIKLAAQLLGGSGDCLARMDAGLEALAHPEPHFFILGNKSYGTSSTFLLQHGIAQVKLVLEHLGRVLRGSSGKRAAGG